MPIRIAPFRKQPLDGARARLAEMCETMASRMAELDQIQAYAPQDQDIEIRLTLSDRSDCEAWDVIPAALGFFAVGTNLRIHEELGYGYREINDRIEVVINLDAATEILARDIQQADELDRKAALESWLVTVPHELLHVLEWIRETDGKTPEEVFCLREGGLNLNLKQVLASIAARWGGADVEEDGMKRRARELTQTLAGDLVSGSAAELAELLRCPRPSP